MKKLEAFEKVISLKKEWDEIYSKSPIIGMDHSVILESPFFYELVGREVIHLVHKEDAGSGKFYLYGKTCGKHNNDIEIIAIDEEEDR